MVQSYQLVWDDYSVRDEDIETLNLLHIDQSSFFLLYYGAPWVFCIFIQPTEYKCLFECVCTSRSFS